MKILFKNGCILEPETGELVKRDILIDGGRIADVAPDIPESSREGAEVWDVSGKFISAGFIDMHVHLREPGFERKETIETGTKAAARGGFTTVACMPNTRPPLDTADKVRQVLEKARETGSARVLPYGAITLGQRGEELTDMAALKEAGVIGVTDDGVGVQNARVMKEAMRLAYSLGLPVVAHTEDNDLARGGCVHDGMFARRHGLPGIPGEAESVQVARDILLAEDVGVHYHVCHISTAQTVRLIREAKARGQKVTCEVTPHHLLLCDEDIPHPDGNWKMNPPLRSAADREALIEGLKDGTIDIIATDHAPHTADEKAQGMRLAPFGIVGLETAFPLLYTHLVLKGILTLKELVDKLTVKPAEVFGLPWGRLAPGLPADLTVIDLELERPIEPDTFRSKGRNTPFAGWRVKGWPVLTLLGGEVTWDQAETAFTFGE
ncbi:dihydroorotase [Staphylospora marina]|uniref:dihydroorotase n=1 Tax=Staphylospora marina TaxID=2490858 RepID=UPI000F5B9919|nr:dihydroorotase [Staphylospora marina]